MNKKIIWFLVSCLMVVTLLVASCGGAVTDEDVNGDEGDGNGVVNGGDDEEEEEVEVDTEGKDMVVNTAGKLVEKPQYGGWYHMRRSTDVRGFDDVLPSTPNYAIYHVGLVTDELYTGDWAKGPQGTGEASWTISSTYFHHLEVPSLATGFEMPDDETIIWHIRQGIHFHDKPPVNGRELNAHDVAFNLSRTYMTPGSYLYNTYRPDRGEGPISITAIDDWTVEMKVPPARQIPILFAANDYTFMYPPEVIEEYGDMANWENLCGTGAFFLTDYVPVSSLTFERNPDYWMTNPLHPEDQLPYVDGIKVFIIPDATTSQAAFRVGKLETASFVKEDWEAITATNPDLEWRRSSPGSSPAIFMRQDNPDLPYQDIRVRKALFYAINHQEILDEYYEGEAEMISSPIANIADFSRMYTPLEEFSEEVQKFYGYYPEEAIELLAEAGYPDGFTCTILCSTEGMVPLIKDYWADIGVNLEIDLRQTNVVSSIVMGGQHEDMYYSSAQGTVVLKCNHWRTDSYFNFSKIQNDYFDEQFEIFNANMLNWDKLCEIYREMAPILREEAYWIDLPASYSYYMWWPWLKAWHGETCVGYFNSYYQFKYLWIDTDLREEMVGFAR